MWARVKKAHIEKKLTQRSPQGKKLHKSHVGQGQPMGFLLQHEKSIIKLFSDLAMPDDPYWTSGPNNPYGSGGLDDSDKPNDLDGLDD